MKTTEYIKLPIWAISGEGLIPVNQVAIDIIQNGSEGELIHMKRAVNRDLRFHQAYMVFITHIYKRCTNQFKNKIPKEKFYLFLKHLAGDFNLIFEFKDGTKMIEYFSISFSKMDNKTFKDYVRGQLPFIYTELIGKFYEGAAYDNVINDIESEFLKFLSKLNAVK